MEPLRNSMSGAQLVEERRGLFQIECLKAFGEPAVDRSNKVASLLQLTLFAPKVIEKWCNLLDINRSAHRKPYQKCLNLQQQIVGKLRFHFSRLMACDKADLHIALCQNKLKPHEVTYSKRISLGPGLHDEPTM